MPGSLQHIEQLQRIATAVDQTDDMVFITDRDGVIQWVNASFEQVTGYSRDVAIGKNPRILKSGHHPPAFYETLWKMILSGVTFRARFVNRKKNGDHYVDDRTITPVRNERNEIVAFVSTGKDITNQLRLQAELERTSKILNSFFKYSVGPMVLLDKEFNFIEVNEAYARACQKRIGDFPGHNHFEFYPSDAEAEFRKVVATRQPVRFSRRPFVFADHPEWGVTYWDWTLTPIVDNDGNVEFLVFSLNDVTQQVRAEEKLRESEQYLRNLLDVMGDTVFTVSYPERIIKYANRAMSKMFGYVPEEIVGRSTRTLYAEDEGYVAFGRLCEQTVRSGNQHLQAEMRLRRKTGELFWAQIHTSFPQTPDAPQHAISVVRDITERKKAEDQLARSRHHLRLLYTRLQQAREEERSRIARELHDSIGQALTGLKIDLSLVEQDILRVRNNDVDAGIGKRFEAMNKLIDVTLDIARNVSVELRPVILDSLGFGAAVEWLASEFQKKFGIHTTCTVPRVRWDELDRNRSITLFRILQEALTNVARHARANHVWVNVHKSESAVELEVLDDGVGFDPSNATDVHTLGLLGMNERAEACGGSLEIARRSEGGTRVRASIPIDRRSQP